MRITTSAEAAQRDADAIAAGIDSWALMHAAGSAAAQFVARIAIDDPAAAIVVFAGTGNNGGDAYVVAAELLNNHFNVVLVEAGTPRTPDARRARDLFRSGSSSRASETNSDVRGDAQADVQRDVQRDEEADREADDVPFIVVDGLLGTGQQGRLREREHNLCNRIQRFRHDGARVVALDVPTGVNASTGETVEGAVRAHHTLAFGTMKRAHVLQREQCGEVLVFDIGLGDFADGDDAAWTLADRVAVADAVPPIKWSAYKGTRGQLAIIGGHQGMSGAVTLASQAALRSGIGLVHVLVQDASVLPLQISVPQAIAHAWSNPAAREMLCGMNAIAIGPGFGRGEDSRAQLRALLSDMPTVPLVLDADALTLIGDDSQQLASLTAERTVVCTPHVGEFARLRGRPVASNFADRVAQAQEYANRTGVVLLLKGTPTVVATPVALFETMDASMLGVSPLLVARGTPVLATGGSGDMLTGIVGTLLAQGVPGPAAAASAAWVHGRSAEVATTIAGSVRGVTLEHVLAAMTRAWRELLNRPDVAERGELGIEDALHPVGTAAAVAYATAGLPILAHLPAVWNERP